MTLKILASFALAILPCASAYASWTDCPTDNKREFKVLYPGKDLETYDQLMPHYKRITWFVPVSTPSWDINREKTLANLLRQLNQPSSPIHGNYRVTCKLASDGAENVSYACLDSKGNSSMLNQSRFGIARSQYDLMLYEKSGVARPFRIFDHPYGHKGTEEMNIKSEEFILCTRDSPDKSPMRSQVHLSVVHQLYDDSNGKEVSKVLPYVIAFTYLETPIKVQLKQIPGFDGF